MQNLRIWKIFDISTRTSPDPRDVVESVGSLSRQPRPWHASRVTGTSVDYKYQKLIQNTNLGVQIHSISSARHSLSSSASIALLPLRLSFDDEGIMRRSVPKTINHSSTFHSTIVRFHICCCLLCSHAVDVCPEATATASKPIITNVVESSSNSFDLNQ